MSEYEISEAVTITEEIVREAFRPRRRSSRKGENGAVLVTGGSWLYHGAPTLTALAALRSGVDLVYLAVPDAIAPCVRAISPNLIVLPLPDSKLTVGCVNRLLKWLPKVDSAAIGPGLGKQKTEGMQRLVIQLVDRGVKLLLDADALNLDVVSKAKGKPCVITPHAGEFRRVFDVELGLDVGERGKIVKEKAKDAGVTILLKGAIDVISDGVRLALNYTGTPAMTVGGTGDVLSGLVSGLMAKGAEPYEAAVAGAYVNGLAGEKAAGRLGLHIMATDVVEELPYVLKKFDRIVD